MKKIPYSLILLNALLVNSVFAAEDKDSLIDGLYKIKINKEFNLIADIKLDNKNLYIPKKYIKEEMYEKFNINKYIQKINNIDYLSIDKSLILKSDSDEMNMEVVLDENYFKEDQKTVKKIGYFEKEYVPNKENVVNYLNNNYVLTLDRFKKLSGYVDTKYSSKNYWSIKNKTVYKGSDLVRIGTTYKKEFADKSAIEIGDINEDNFGNLFALNGMGVKYSTNYFNNNANSNLIESLPQYSVNGFSVTPSIFNIYNTSNSLLNNEINSGNYNLIMPYSAGYGEYSGYVKDYLGNIQEFKMPYYNSNKLLKDGGLEYSISLASVRKNQYTKSFDYAKPFFSGVLKYGINKQITQDFGISYSSYYKNFYTSTNFYIDPKYGIFQVGLNYNENNQALYNIGWELYSKSAFTFKINTAFTDKNKAYCIDYLKECIKEQSRYTVGYKLLDGLGVLSYQYLTEKKQFTDFESHRVMWSIPVNNHLNVSFIVEDNKNHNATNISAVDNKKFLFLMNYNFNDKYNANANYQKNDNYNTLQTRFSVAENREHPEYGYGNITMNSYRGNNISNVESSRVGFNYFANLDHFSYRVENENINQLQNSKITLQGSALYVEDDHQISFNKDINGLVLVDVDDKNDDVEIFYQNKLAGKTNQDGKYIVTKGIPYLNEKVEINLNNLAIDKNYEEFKQEIKVPEYGALKVKFKKIENDFDIKISNLSSGSILKSGSEEYVVGKNGKMTINKEGIYTNEDNNCSFTVSKENKDYICK